MQADVLQTPPVVSPVEKVNRLRGKGTKVASQKLLMKAAVYSMQLQSNHEGDNKI